MTEYGEIFPTEPGLAALTTKPDPTRAASRAPTWFTSLKSSST